MPSQSLTTRWFVILAIGPPAGTPPMAQREATAAGDALHDLLDRARQAVTAMGDLVAVLDRRVGAHPAGAMASLVVDAPTGDAARDAITALIGHAMHTCRPLRGWQLTEISVELCRLANPECHGICCNAPGRSE